MGQFAADVAGEQLQKAYYDYGPVVTGERGGGARPRSKPPIPETLDLAS